jgi:hypothetical protein
MPPAPAGLALALAGFTVALAGFTVAPAGLAPAPARFTAAPTRFALRPLPKPQSPPTAADKRWLGTCGGSLGSAEVTPGFCDRAQ